MAQGEGAGPCGGGDEGGRGARIAQDGSAGAVLARTAARYRGCDRFTRHYIPHKVRMDPVHAAVLALAAARPFGAVLDLGCGRGQIGVALLEAGGAGSVVAVDHDRAALDQLEAAASGLALRTRWADLSLGVPAEPSDTVLLVDVLYQLESAPQVALLRSAAQLARATVVIRASDPDAGWRSRLSALLEWLGGRFWPTFARRSNPLPPDLLARTLTACGFAVTITACAQGTPLAGRLLVGRRVAPNAAGAGPPSFG